MAVLRAGHVVDDGDPLDRVSFSRIVPAPKIEAGKCYITRNGRKVGPMTGPNARGQYRDTSRSVSLQWWYENGDFILGSQSSLDIVCEAPERLVADLQIAQIDPGAVERLAAEGPGAVSRLSGDVELVRPLAAPAKNPLYATCKACLHVWPALYLPMPLQTAATAMSRATCPQCGETKKITVATAAEIAASGKL